MVQFVYSNELNHRPLNNRKTTSLDSSIFNKQKLFFEEIKNTLGPEKDFVSELGADLSLGKSAIYKRINGDTMLSMSEMGALAKKYGISLDKLFDLSDHQITFDFPRLETQPESFQEYLSPIIADLEALQALPGKVVYYATDEVPLFHYLYSPELTLFKMFVWARTVWRSPGLQLSKFSFEIGGPKIKEMIAKALRLYCEVDSVEFWGINILDNTLSQIQYYAESGLFENIEDAAVLHDQMQGLIKTLRMNAEKATKKQTSLIGKEGNFTLYYNEMLHINNTIYVKSDLASAVYVTFDNPNFMQSQDARILEYTEEWFNKLKRNSTCISQESERGRIQFFEELNRRMARKSEEMKLLINARSIVD